MLPFGLFTILSTIVFCVYLSGVHHLLTLQSSDKCEMTYMFQYPQFVKIQMAEDISKAYPQYGLFAYGEGHITSELRSGKFTGIPVLFVPGSAGSFKQARSLASVSLRKALNTNSLFHLDFFTVNLNEEYSGLSGHVLKTQTEFLRSCVYHILKIYKHSKDNPKSIIVVGHSMGGLITKGLFVDPQFDPDNIRAFLTLATPHVSPIVACDSKLSKYYSDVNKVWRSQRHGRLANITMASIGGGDLDLIVRSGVTYSWEADVSTVATGVPTVWRPVDHLSIVWCKQLVFTLVRMLFDLVDRQKMSIIADPSLRREVVKYHLEQRDSGKHFPKPYESSVVFEKQADWSEVMFGQFNDSSSGKEIKHHLIPLNPHSSRNMLSVRAVHFFIRDWLFACKADQDFRDFRICTSGDNLSNYTRAIPTLYQQWKGAVIPLRPLVDQGYTHVVLRFPKTAEPWTVFVDAHNSKSRTLTAPPQLTLGNIFKAKKLFRILNESDFRALTYTIEFPDVKAPWHAATVYVYPKDNCPHNAAGKMIVPWSKEERVGYFSKARRDFLTVGAGSPCPANWEGAPVRVEVHLDPRCTYSISIGSAPRQVLGQMTLTYTPMLIAYASVALILALRDQFATLSEGRPPSMFHVALARGAKPYAILTLAKLGSRFAVLRGSGPLPTLLIKMGMPDPDELMTSTGTWEQIFVPLVIYACAFAITFIGGLVCLIGVVFWGNLSSKLAASVVGHFLKGTIFTWIQSLFDWRWEVWTRLPTVCVIVLLALGYASCSALAMACGGIVFFLKICGMYEDYLGALVAYSLKVLSGKKQISWQGLFEPDQAKPRKKDPNEEELLDLAEDESEGNKGEEQVTEEEEENRPGLSQISVHITTLMIYFCAFVPCVPSLLVWAHNFNYNPRLDQDDMWPPLIIMAVCGLSWIHSYPKPHLRFYEPMCYFLFGVALLLAMYTPVSIYRTPYFIAATFSVIALHQIFAPQGDPPPKESKNSDKLDFALVEKMLEEDEITTCGDIIKKGVPNNRRKAQGKRNVGIVNESIVKDDAKREKHEINGTEEIKGLDSEENAELAKELNSSPDIAKLTQKKESKNVEDVNEDIGTDDPFKEEHEINRTDEILVLDSEGNTESAKELESSPGTAKGTRKRKTKKGKKSD